MQQRGLRDISNSFNNDELSEAINLESISVSQVSCINEKKAVRLIETFRHKAGEYAQKVNHIFEVLGFSLIECAI